MGAVSTIWAPLHRALKRVPLGSAGFPPNAAPNMDFLSSGIQDHRIPYNARGSSSALPGILGWYGAGHYITANYVPSAIATANIAALANAVSGTPLALVGATGAGITVLSASAPAVFYANPVTVAAGVAIDGLPSLHLFGASGNFTTGFYNRGTCVGRAVSISGVVNGAGGAFLVSGYDIYGFPQTQTVTVAAGANTVASTKAFKVITSVTPQFSDAHNYSVGTADVYGFGIVASYVGDTWLNFNSTWITASAGFTAADTTSPATATTGDVRGTYATQSASDGTKRLIMGVAPTLGSLVTNPTTGLFGTVPA